MGHRPLLAADRLPLVGGAVCLDLVNTTGARDSGRPRERLLTYDALLVWSRRAGVLDGTETARLAAAALKRPTAATRALQRARALREQLYGLFRAIAEGRDAPEPLVRRLGAWWRADRRRRELICREGTFELRLSVGRDELDRMLWPIVSSAVELLTAERLTRLKRCGICDWLFIDESRNGSRRWCKVACGNRARVRRHYQRVRRGRAAGH